MGKGICPSRSDSKRKGIEESTAEGTEGKTVTRGERSDNLQRENCQEKVIQRSELRCFYTNANSLIQKIDKLRDRVYRNDYDIVAVVETWAHDSVGDAELSITGYDSYRVDRKGHKGGGVIVYIKEKLRSILKKNINVESMLNGVLYGLL